MILVEETGPLALIEDLGRSGLAHLGVPPSGAADRSASALANRLVGNAEGAAVVEVTLGGLAITTTKLHWVAVTGAPTQLLIDTQPTSSHTALSVRPGERLRIEPPEEGVRNYLAVRGGLSAPKTLGSRSTDVLSGLGPPVLRPGDTFDVGQATGVLPGIDIAPPRRPSKQLEVLPGPRRDWFTDQAWNRLLSARWTTSIDADRVNETTAAFAAA